MKNQFSTYFKKSKALLVALLFLCPILQAAESHQDTIIIGNTTLLIERIVEVDSLAPEVPHEKPKKKRENLSVGVFLNSGLSNSSLTSTQYTSINELTGKPARASFTFGAGVSLEYKVHDQISIFTELGLDQVSWKQTNFDLNTIDDSLYFFESLNEDQLSQIIRNRYEIGGSLETETDTIGIDLRNSKLTMFNLSVPLGVRYQQPFANRKSTFTWDVSLALVYNKVLSKKQPSLVLIESENTSSALQVDSYSIKEDYFTARLEFGVVKKLKDSQYLFLRYQAETPSQLMEENTDLKGANWNGWNNRLKIGFNIFL